MMSILMRAGLSLCLLCGPALAMADEEVLAPSLTVTGAGEVKAPPDMAVIQAGVTSQADSAAEALEHNSAAMRNLMEVLHDQGVAKKDIQTSQFTISPRYEHDPKQPRANEIIGYQVTNQVQITVRDLNLLGELLDKVVTEGANQVHGIQFSVAEPDRLLDEARRKAVADAQRKAKLYAEAADVRLGRILLIQEESPQAPRPYSVRGFSEARALSVPIAEGELKFEASIQITYRLQ